MRILALDPSTTNVGWCFGFDDHDTPVRSGVYTPKGKVDERLIRIHSWAHDLMLDLGPDLVAVEEPAGDHRNRKTDRLLANVTGILLSVSLETEVWDFIRVYPSQVKATKCSKDNPVYAAATAGKPEVGPDEADAIGVWLVAVSHVRERRLLHNRKVS